jgi:hypothetical protein
MKWFWDNYTTDPKQRRHRGPFGYPITRLDGGVVISAQCELRGVNND